MACLCGKLTLDDGDARDAADTLHNAMDGMGTTEEDIVKLLVTHNNAQRQIIADTYAVAYGESLLERLKSELSGDLEDCVVGLMTTPRDYDAKMLYDAMSGMGTDEHTLIGVLCSRTTEEIEEIKEAYKRLYDSELIEDLQGETSGPFGKMMYAITSGNRQDGYEDDDRVEEDAQKLIDAGFETFGTDESAFNSILCACSYPHLKAVIRKYKDMREGVSLEEDIASELSSDLKDGCLAIVKVTNDKEAFFAERLYKAMKGFGTDDNELIRVIISRAETDLTWVGDKYAEMYEGASLFDNVNDECSGYYKSLLLSIISGRFVSKDE